MVNGRSSNGIGEADDIVQPIGTMIFAEIVRPVAGMGFREEK